MAIFRLAESFKTMNRSGLTVTLFEDYSSKNTKHLKFEHNPYTSLQFVLLGFGTDIFDGLETMGFSVT